MRRLSWAWLLPVLLLLAQYGQVRHELEHTLQVTSKLSRHEAPRPADTERCNVCLAYAHLSGAATLDVPGATLVADLAFHHALALAWASSDPLLPAARSRGPPLASSLSLPA